MSKFKQVLRIIKALYFVCQLKRDKRLLNHLAQTMGWRSLLRRNFTGGGSNTFTGESKLCQHDLLFNTVSCLVSA